MQKKLFLIFISTLFLQNACVKPQNNDFLEIDSELVEDIEADSKIHKEYHYTGNTYQWTGADISLNDPDGVWHNPDFNYEEYISTTIKKQLQNFGLIDSPDSDITISFDINVNMDAIKVKSFFGTKEQLVLRRPENTLSISIRDITNKEILWSGWVNSEYRNYESELATKRIDYSISEILKKLPSN